MPNLINIPIELTDVGYQKALQTDGVAITIKELALGQGAGSAGYTVGFRDDKTALVGEVVRKQIDASKRNVEQGKIDLATLFDGDEEFDIWELGFFDEDGDLVYIWSHETEKFAPKSKFLQLAVSLSLWVRHINIDQVTVNDSGQPFELFLADVYEILARLTQNTKQAWVSGDQNVFALGSDSNYYIAVAGSEWKTTNPVGATAEIWKGPYTIEDIVGLLVADGANGATIPLASTTQNGLMSKEDKIKLDNIDQAQAGYLLTVAFDPAQPDQVLNASDATFTATGTSLLTGVNISHYKWFGFDGAEINGATSNSITLAASGNEGDTKSVSVIAYDDTGGNGNASAKETHEFTVVLNSPPDVSDAIVTNLPSTIKKNITLDFTVSGITDSDGDTITITATDDSGKITFPALGDNSQLVTGDVATDTAATIVLYANDGRGGRSIIIIHALTILANAAPSAANITSNLPSVLVAGQSYNVTLSGGTDPDGDALSYQLSNVSGCTVNKTADITGAFSLTVNSNTDSVSFTAKCKDPNGLVSENQKVLSWSGAGVNRRPSAANITSNLPSVLVAGQSYNVTLSGGTDPDGDAITYQLSNVSGCTVNKTSNITSAFTLNVSPTASSVSFVARCKDAGGLVSNDSKTLSKSGASIQSPSGSSGNLSAGTHSVTIPAGVASLTLSGRGSAGTYSESRDVPTSYPTFTHRDGQARYHAPYTNVHASGWFTNQSKSSAQNAYGAMPDDVCGVYYGSLPFDSSGNGNRVYPKYNGVSLDCVTVDTWQKRCTMPMLTNVNSAPGAVTRITGAISHTFNGAANGVTTTPATATAIKSISAATASSLTIVVPAGGACRVDW